MHIYRSPPEAKVRELLAACNLPTSDLQAVCFEQFFGCGREDEPKGVVGLELHGNAALLRSLAVDEAMRGRGCGSRLVAEAEQYAARNGAQSLYLLTTTAEGFFRRLGYVCIDRASAPEAIRQTSQFSGLCPSSSVVMMKALGG